MITAIVSACWDPISSAVAAPLHSSLPKCWLRLHTVSLTCFPSSLCLSSSSAEFREPRVIELWEAAKRSNLSEDELDSLKVTLTSLVTGFWTHRLSPICFYITALQSNTWST